DNFLQLHVANAKKGSRVAFGCEQHNICVGDLQPEYFMFNAPMSACRTCMGLGTYMQVHPDLLVPDKTRSINGGAFVRAAFSPDPNSYDGRIMYSLSQHYKFSLDTPFQDLPKKVVEVLLNGTDGKKFALLKPPDAKEKTKHDGQKWSFGGIAKRIERHYKRYRQKQVANSGMEAWLEKVMVEHKCPDCNGARLKPQRLLFTIAGKNIYEFGDINFSELRQFLETISKDIKAKNGSNGLSSRNRAGA